ncbi:hypothetical protein INT44_001234 [Umbelopsis vinacea]|uniref:RRM domain-containing protein n=1 Tax=Umbelopsis vinacea TaxID=44442 RepID=A0A8H7UMC3_9FUNG|nr:hypothetical protein INT44_001234 [Umbelopsis vinacea]
MKRSSDYVNQSNSDINKKPRFTPNPYGDVYSQYGAMNPNAAAMSMSQYSQANAFTPSVDSANGFAALGQFNGANSMYGSMGAYSAAPMMMNTQFAGMANSRMAGGYPQSAFPMGFNAGASMGGASHSGSEPSRTIYLGNLPEDTTYNDILNHVHTGVVESLRLLSEKSCGFLSFLDFTSAQAFYMEYNSGHKLSINGNDVRVGWGKHSTIPSTVQTAVQSGATRNVYLGNLEENITEEELKADLETYGQIEHIKIVPEKHCAFVHFTSISAAINCVTNLPNESKWEGRRVNYGKDRCAYNAKQGGSQSLQNQNFNFQNPFQFAYDPYGSSRNPQMAASQMMSQSYMAGNSATSTTVYLGNIHPDTTCEDICNAIRGGILYQIRYLSDKHIAFVTFMDATAAFNFYQLLTYQGISIKGRRLKGGWGKPVQIPASILMAVQNGASRNVYIGNLDESITEEKLRTDFSEYGDIELINFLTEKSCAFVNFTNVQSAINALEGIKNKDDYRKLKINFGKDRCGNAPRVPKPNSNGSEGSGSRAREGQVDAVASEN